MSKLSGIVGLLLALLVVLVKASSLHQQWQPNSDEPMGTGRGGGGGGELDVFEAQWLADDNNQATGKKASKWAKYKGPVEQDEDSLFRMTLIQSKWMSYVAEILVGRPAKKFRVLLDSGSVDLWLPTEDIPDIDPDIVRTYDPKESDTFVDLRGRKQIEFMGGFKVEGSLGQEVLHFGSLTIRGQQFALVDEMQDKSLYKSARVDGVLGLRMNSSSELVGADSPLINMFKVVKEKSNDARAMASIVLNHGSDPDRMGELIIGGLDKKSFLGDVTWTPLIGKSFWGFRLDKILVEPLPVPLDSEEAPLDPQEAEPQEPKELSVCKNGCNAVADTGTLMVSGPEKEVTELNKMLGAERVGANTFAIEGKCSELRPTLPTLTFVIGGRNFSLEPHQYTFMLLQDVEGDPGPPQDGEPEPPKCFTAITKLPDQRLNYWVVGSVFLRHQYTVLDYEERRMGFARSAYNTTKNVLGQEPE